jgi:hypothetical protein
MNVIENGEPWAPSNGLAPAVAVLEPAVLAPAAVERAAPRRPCQVNFGGMPASEPPRVEVYAWLEKLGSLTAAMTGGQVLIEAVDRGRKDRHYRVRMDLTMPTGTVVVAYDHPSNGPHEDVIVAIRNAFRAARRQLEAHAREAESQTLGAPVPVSSS